MQADANSGRRKRVRVERRNTFFSIGFLSAPKTFLSTMYRKQKTINANISWTDDREVATIGPWRSVVDGTEAGDYLRFHKEMGTRSLYQWLGLELHSAQQGASELTYQGQVVHAVRMEDTCGAPVAKGTLLNVGGKVMPVFAIAADEPIQWPPG